MEMKTIVLIGGYGFLGSHLAEFFQKENKVIILGNFKRNSIRFLKDQKNIELHNVDLLNDNAFSILENYIKYSDVVLNLAAIAGVSNYSKYPVNVLLTNGLGTAKVLDVCKKFDKRLIIFSSSEVYGEGSSNCFEEQYVILDSPKNLRLSYAVSKLFGDHLAYSYYKQFGLPITIVRPFGIYGPRQLGEGGIQIFVRKCINNETLQVVGNGVQTRDWCYVEDLVEAINLILTNDKSIGEIYNIGNPDTNCTILQLAKLIKELTKSSSEIEFIERSGVKDTMFRKCNVNKAGSSLIWYPKTSLKDGLLKTIEWYRENNVGENISV